MLRCEDCASEFDVEDQLKQHKADFELTKCILRCDHPGCEKTFSWLPDLTMHKFDEHECNIDPNHEFKFFDVQNLPHHPKKRLKKNVRKVFSTAFPRYPFKQIYAKPQREQMNYIALTRGDSIKSACVYKCYRK